MMWCVHFRSRYTSNLLHAFVDFCSPVVVKVFSVIAIAHSNMF